MRHFVRISSQDEFRGAFTPVRMGYIIIGRFTKIIDRINKETVKNLDKNPKNVIIKRTGKYELKVGIEL